MSIKENIRIGKKGASHEDLIKEDDVYSKFIDVRKKAIGWSIG
ncbi:hypothetical protein J2Z42_002610 [Clostridium algifaecis]|uniref:ABC transporter ATP-binding protein n=1 Tax=Clostridium algifaecis TaxID=1472040 RepID=A0ABS4KV27_9CLOT|nr:hypothetical protein [Clostridium algifaecis]MBP2033897.1 hypothetical protein [Clostridium algifaecis]